MMPKKIVMLVDTDSAALSVRKFLLETWGYVVIALENARTALAVLEANPPGKVLVLVAEAVMEPMSGDELCVAAKSLDSELKVLLLSSADDFIRDHHADIFLPRRGCNPEMVLDKVKMLAIRKRGPKKALTPAIYVPADEVAA